MFLFTVPHQEDASSVQGFELVDLCLYKYKCGLNPFKKETVQDISTSTLKRGFGNNMFWQSFDWLCVYARIKIMIYIYMTYIIYSCLLYISITFMEVSYPFLSYNWPWLQSHISRIHDASVESLNEVPAPCRSEQMRRNSRNFNWFQWNLSLLDPDGTWNLYNLL